MFSAGFLGTKAPFFMDAVTLIVALLPFLALYGMTLVRKGHYGFHAFYQILLFIISVAVVLWFEYGVRSGGGFSSFAEGNHHSMTLLLAILITHIVISTATTIYWGKTLIQAYMEYEKSNLPGGFSLRHIMRAKRTIFGIFMTSLTGIWVYLILFVY